MGPAHKVDARVGAGNHYEALTVTELVEAVAAAEANDQAPVEPGGKIAIADSGAARMVSFTLDSGASHSLTSAEVLATLQKGGHILVRPGGIRHVKRTWQFGQGGAVSSCDVIALVHFWGGPAMAAEGGFSMTLRFSVVREADVPTLIGQSTLEAVGAVIDHQARTVRFRGATGPVIRTARSPTGHLILKAYKTSAPYLHPAALADAHQGAASFDFLAQAGSLTDDTCDGALASAGADLPKSQGRAGLRVPLLGQFAVGVPSSGGLVSAWVSSDVAGACAARGLPVPSPVKFSGAPATPPRGSLRVPIKDLSPEKIEQHARWVHIRWGHCGMAETNRRISLGVFSDEMAAATRRATQQCSQCIDHRRAPSVIEAACPRFSAFNDCVELDVFFLGRAKVPMVAMVDVMTTHGHAWRSASGRHWG